MTAVARCDVCNVTFISAVAWFQHIDEVHRPNRELVCPMCERPFPAEMYMWHPCTGEVFGRHPSKRGATR